MEQHCTGAHALRDRDIETLHALACQFDKQGLHGKAQDLLALALSFRPASAHLARALGLSLMRSRRYREAIVPLSIAMRGAGRDDDALTALAYGECLALSGYRAAARRVLLRAGVSAAAREGAEHVAKLADTWLARLESFEKGTAS